MRALKRLVLVGLMAASAHVVSAPSLSNCDVRMSMDVYFPFHSVGIPRPYFEKLVEFLHAVRKADFCPMGAVIVVGHADATEGSASEIRDLAEQRAENISRFFRSAGFPSYFLHTESKGDSQPLSRNAASEQDARVDIDVGAGCPSDTCPVPISEDGFRHLKDWMPDKH